jgi:hypothetical protein
MVTYDFPVEKQSLFLKSGEEAEGRIAIVRTDTNKVLGIVGQDYQLLKHEDAVNKAETALSSFGKFKKRNAIITHNGAHMRIHYDFMNMEKIVANTPDGKPDAVVPRLTLTNSYDGMVKFGFVLGSMQLICTNGLRLNHDIFEIVRKHTSGLNINDISEKAGSAFEYFMNRSYPRFLEMGKTPVSDPKSYIEGLKDKEVPVKLLDKVAERAMAKTYMHYTEWGIYSEFTGYLTHNYGDERKDKKRIISEDRRDELNRIVAKAFGL